MSKREILYPDSVSKRELPANLDRADLALFEHELEKAIPATALLRLKNVTVNTDGILFCGGKVLPESFASPRQANAWRSPKARLKFFVKNRLLGNAERIDSDFLWITDDWSIGYFHWMTDALPRLFAIQKTLGDAVLLLPGAFQKEKYVAASLKPFGVRNVKFIKNTVHCKSLRLPTHTAPTGNYNENIIKGLRHTFVDFYRNVKSERVGERIYISRSKARWSKIVNEEEVAAVLKEFDFKTVYFEDYSFDEQVKIASEARYMISNHGASLTNMLFMKQGGGVFELRRTGDAHNNCYFALASALKLRYFYQICATENLDERANTTDLLVDCESFRRNIEWMLSD